MHTSCETSPRPLPTPQPAHGRCWTSAPGVRRTTHWTNMTLKVDVKNNYSRLKKIVMEHIHHCVVKADNTLLANRLQISNGLIFWTKYLFPPRSPHAAGAGRLHRWFAGRALVREYHLGGDSDLPVVLDGCDGRGCAPQMRPAQIRVNESTAPDSHEMKSCNNLAQDAARLHCPVSVHSKTTAALTSIRAFLRSIAAKEA